MSNELNGTQYDGEAMTQKQADAPVAQHKEGLSFRGVPVEYDNEMPVRRHSPEGFEEVLKTASEAEAQSASGRILAAEAVRLLQAWLDGETLEYLYFNPDGWVEYTGSNAPQVQAPGSQWRIKRIPRKVWVAFHEGGSVRDIRALEPDVNPDGPAYIEFEEKLS